jgi:antitoxin MazE
MQVFKWGNSLAVVRPKKLVEALNLTPGDELDVVDVSKGTITVEKTDKRTEFLRQVEALRFPMTEGCKFDRDDANER